jgi:hypothetical protein
MISSSMMASLIRGLPDWTTKTSFSRTLVKILTLVSPFEKPVSLKSSPQRPCRRKTQAERINARLDGRTALTLENCVSSASAGVMPRFSQIWPVRAGHELPAKMSVLRMIGLGKDVPKRRKEKRDGPAFASAPAASCVRVGDGRRSSLADLG